MIIVGYDPGGIGSGGVAVIDYSQLNKIIAMVATVSCVNDALKFITGHCRKHILAVGIDTILSWSLFNNGWRPMDLYLRHHYKAVRNSIVAPNSLRGAMAIQGAALAISLKRLNVNILINETHPKVQYYALSTNVYNYSRNTAQMSSWLLGQISCNRVCISNDHEWDALFSAWATFMGLTQNWPYDLSTPYPDLIYPSGYAKYYWP